MASMSPSSSSSSYHTAMPIRQQFSALTVDSDESSQKISSRDQALLQEHNNDTSTISTSATQSTQSDNVNDDAIKNKYLGFSQNLVAYLQQSRKRLDTFIEEQMDQSTQMHMALSDRVQQENDEIRQLMKQVVDIQSSRGVMSDQSKVKMAKTVNRSLDNDMMMKENHHPNSQPNTAKNDSRDLVKKRQTLQHKQESMAKELAKLQGECSKLQKEVQQSTEQEDIEYAKVQQVRKEKALVEQSKLVTVEDLTYAVLQYKYLGLDFVKGDQHCDVKCNFTKIDPNDDERVFTFSLTVSDVDDQYEVRDCHPELSTEVVMTLVEELNCTTMLPPFFRGMRDAFINSI